MWLLTFTTSLLFVTTSCVLAQHGKLKVKASQNEIPEAVVDAFLRSFSDADSLDWTIVSGPVILEEYSVTGYNDKVGQSPTYYFIGFVESGRKGEAVYDHYGKLLLWKEIVRNGVLPEVVKRTAVKRFPEYSIGDRQEIVRDGNSGITHYRVIMSKATDSKVVAIDGTGKIVREK